jgi:alcohol dehydrogenase
MRAVLLRDHGGLDQMEYVEDFANPEPGEGDVLIKVKATSYNYHDIFTRRGMPGIRIPMPIIMGIDIAGEVAALGAGVEGWKIGDRVLIDPINRVEGGLMGETRHGGLAEYCVTRAHQLIALPDDISFEQAASLPVAYGTALRMMTTIGQVSAGEKVLILGASGGVGICCVQLAKAAGAYVIACAGSAEKGERLTEIGADEIILYNEVDFMQECRARHGKPRAGKASKGSGVDMVVNFTGGDTWVPSLKCLRKGGRLVTCGATAGFDPTEDIRFIWTFELRILGSNGWEREDILKLFELIRAGKMKAVIDRTFPLENAIEAMGVLEARKVLGKLVVTP